MKAPGAALVEEKKDDILHNSEVLNAIGNALTERELLVKIFPHK